ncbi:Ig-like domain-containing protein [Clostridium cellulovorans]|uniref:Ig domain protein group 2 domain protein n=1 Tax=Clostridium cellulovorans (strain ATCC 35296 / DSM 3052 / OCM 3 / 743B) TaxID=573061 RepID=D9STN3_CLOC7|nr:Ig-like domain-containing protein [Clostridium cellulovorans]ADL52767.1 Ig domain protein group 2 domain protein [Clostridium cellulovorans 743B]
MIKNFLKKTLITTSLLLTFQLSITTPTNTTVNAATGSNYTWNNTIPAKYPSATNDNGKLVLFDNSHGETAGQADWVLDGGFSDFADDLVNHGYTVKEYRGIDKNGDGCIRYYDDRQTSNVDSNEAVITYDAIKDADVFIMAEANRPLTISERSALKQFVDSGKGLYLISDHYNADRNMNTWDSTEVYNGYNRSNSTIYNMGLTYGDMRNPQDATKGWLAENFGLRFRFNAINLTAGFSGIRSTTDSEGITAGVKPILMAAGSTLAIVDGSKAKGLVYLSSTDKPSKWGSAADTGLYFGGEKEGAFVAISKPSAGKAAFIGDSSPIEDATTKYKHEGTGNSKSTHAGYTSAGNAATLSINIVDWLSTPESYVGFDGINHTKGIATDTPMATIEKTESQAEPWATPSYNPWNTDTFAYGAYNAPQGPISTSTGGSGTGTTTVSVTGVSLNKTSLSLTAGATQTLTATIAPTNATNKSISWTSSNTSVATVSSGTITAISLGTAIITAKTTDGAKTATCEVTVSASSTGTGTVTLISEGFTTVRGTSSAISSGIPTNWIFSSGLAVYTTTGNYGKSSPSIKMQGTNNRVTTPTFTLSTQGTLSFWIKGNGTNSTSALLVEKYDGTSWSTVANITSLPITGTTKTYTIPQNTIQVRLTYTKSVGNVALDDISIK